MDTTSHAVSFGTDSPSPSPMTMIEKLLPSTETIQPSHRNDTEAELEDYFKSSTLYLQLVLVFGYTIMFIVCGLLIAYMRYHRTHALRGDVLAARKIILPAFEPLLWILMGSTGVYTVLLVWALLGEWYVYTIPMLMDEILYSGRQFVLLLPGIYMLRKSVSRPALIRAIAISLFLSTYTIILHIMCLTIYKAHSKQDVFLVPIHPTHYWLIVIFRSLIILVYIYIAVWPPARASKQRLREFCGYAIIYQVFIFTYYELYHENLWDQGFIVRYCAAIWGALAPLPIWRLLQADTQHWRGLGQRAVLLQSLFRERFPHRMHERISSQGLHVLIEMHRKFIIDFAYLEIKDQIGQGSSAVVFNGVLHSKTQVAVKVYTPIEFTEETVAEFSQEAALCGALHHPNVVEFYGMCVFPPAICLVSELCQGSLWDISQALAKQREEGKFSPTRKQSLIDLSYMIDAARAVAYIHSFSPAFIHRDIKPSNFLVDASNTVKLTDFGESRELPRSSTYNNNRSNRNSPNNSGSNDVMASSLTSSMAKEEEDNFTLVQDRDNTTIRESCITMHSLAASNCPRPESTGSSQRSTFLSMGLGGVSINSTLSCVGGAGYKALDRTPATYCSASQMTVKGTVDYMAPELIQGRAGLASYGEAADVYALAVTMWDILNPGEEKFPHLKNNHLRVFESVMEGKRPELSENMHPQLRDIIQSSWHSDPRMRPTAQQIVSVLEYIQEDMYASFAKVIKNQVTPRLMTNKEYIHSFVGSQAHSMNGRVVVVKALEGLHVAESFIGHGYVADTREAVRMGNALMDAGYLHHIKHHHPFEATERAMYYLDNEAIRRARVSKFSSRGPTSDSSFADTPTFFLKTIGPSNIINLGSREYDEKKFEMDEQDKSTTADLAQPRLSVNDRSHSGKFKNLVVMPTSQTRERTSEQGLATRGRKSLTSLPTTGSSPSSSDRPIIQRSSSMEEGVMHKNESLDDENHDEPVECECRLIGQGFIKAKLQTNTAKRSRFGRQRSKRRLKSGTPSNTSTTSQSQRDFGASYASHERRRTLTSDESKEKEIFPDFEAQFPSNHSSLIDFSDVVHNHSTNSLSINRA